AAVEEDVDVIGISTLSGSHLTLFPKIIDLMNHYNIGDIPFVAGGIIPAEDITVLKQMGVKEIFPPETPTSEIVNSVKNLFR
ncbi:methylmalonyl-CoA mutase, partial [Chloroflexota bacterium]